MDQDRSIDFFFRAGSAGSYAFRPCFMPALRAELESKLRPVLGVRQEDDRLVIMGDAVVRRLANWEEHGPVGPPLLHLSEAPEIVPQEITDAFMTLVDPASDSGNDWIERRVGLPTEVRAAIDELARRVARLAGLKVVRPF